MEKRTIREHLYFRPIMDWWVAALGVLIVLLFLAGVYVFMGTELSIYGKVIGAGGLLIACLLLIDTLFFTYYELAPESLIIASQLRHAEFSYKDIREVQSCGLKGLLSFRGRKRFALSARSLYIRCEHSHWRGITVSPVQRDIFIESLLEHVDAERADRVTKKRTKK